MEKHQNKKLSVEFPAEKYVLLKMTCARKGVSIKDFVNQSVMKSIEEFEDEEDIIALGKITDEDRKNAIPWKDVKKELGWDQL